jgi:acetyl-CoA carboxylase carboxyl transferase subunit alpha
VSNRRPSFFIIHNTNRPPLLLFSQNLILSPPLTRKGFKMLDFEKPVIELETKVRDLRQTGQTTAGVNLGEEITRLEAKIQRLLKSTYASLTPKQRVQVARHEKRPHFVDYIGQMIDGFTPLSGDRLYGDDHALMGGLGRFRGQAVVVIGHEKGSDLNTRLKHNFGMPCPEGYRKAIRLMKMADQFKLPVITLVDTAGAYPGVEAEARGQAEAIAQSINTCLSINVPIISVIMGEGGSGWRHCDCDRRPGLYAGEFGLFRYFSRRMCFHPVAQRNICR